MKIEKLTDYKIRIIFKIDDLESKNIDVHSLTKNTSSTQSFFKKVLKETQKKVDFNVDDSILLIEAYTSIEGYFVITFTKLPDKYELEQKKVSLKHLCSSIYLFNTFDEFCNFCTYLSSYNYINLSTIAKRMSLYRYNSEYFLVLSEINHDSKEFSLLCTLISEFAQHSINSSIFVNKLNEYGTVIFKNNAIKNGIKFFANT